MHRIHQDSINIVYRELSKGHFSDDNQKRLGGTDAGIPIFEAKMTRDTRLVVRLVKLPCTCNILFIKFYLPVYRGLCQGF